VTINQIEFFVSLAKFLNFTKASRAMHITQPAFSRQISNMEEELGIVLFQRNKRSVQLSVAGNAFIREAEKVLIHYNKGIVMAQQAKAGQLGSINIGFLESLAKLFLPDFISNFRDNNPDIHLKFDEFDHTSLAESLRNYEVDIAFTTSEGINLISNITWKSIFVDYHCVVMHRDHPLASNDSINITSLANESFILMNPRNSDQGNNASIQMCLDHGFYPKVVSEASFINSLLFLVDCKEGIAFLPKHLQYMASPNIRFIKLENCTTPIEVIAAWKRNNSNPCLRRFIDEIEVSGRGFWCNQSI
jgi:DNA-binding transcriptional LysR family regulator